MSTSMTSLVINPGGTNRFLQVTWVKLTYIIQLGVDTDTMFLYRVSEQNSLGSPYTEERQCARLVV
jgi:hypothetical protein